MITLIYDPYKNGWNNTENRTYIRLCPNHTQYEIFLDLCQKQKINSVFAKCGVMYNFCLFASGFKEYKIEKIRSDQLELVMYFNYITEKEALKIYNRYIKINKLLK